MATDLASLKEKKVFVLGATGFIGSAVVKRLGELGLKNIHCLYRSEDKREQLCSCVDASSIRFLRGDVSEVDCLRRGVEGADIVLNASGLATDWGRKRDIWQVNVEAPKAIVNMIREMKARTHYIHITSASVYGFSKVEKTESSPLAVSDPFYTASKVAVHSWLREEMRKGHPFPITILAPSIVWGVGDRIYIPGIKDQLRTGQVFDIGGAEAVDLVHIDDLVDAILLCFSNERSYDQEYIITGPERFTFREYIAKIAEFAELPPPKRTVPLWLAMGLASAAELSARLASLWGRGDRPLITRLQVRLLAMPFRVSNAKAGEELGYHPQIDFAQGIDGLKEYVREL